jgi:hypothetical protein
MHVLSRLMLDQCALTCSALTCAAVRELSRLMLYTLSPLDADDHEVPHSDLFAADRPYVGSRRSFTIYRKQLRPVIEGGAEVMDRILPAWPSSEP